MSPAAQRLLHAAAVLGEPFDVDPAVEIGALAAEEAAPAIDELLSTQLVQATRVSGRLVFRHPLIRRAVYEQIGYGTRRAIHHSAAVVPAARGADLSIRAHHLERSSTVGDEATTAGGGAAGSGKARTGSRGHRRRGGNSSATGQSADDAHARRRRSIRAGTHRVGTGQSTVRGRSRAGSRVTVREERDADRCRTGPPAVGP